MGNCIKSMKKIIGFGEGEGSFCHSNNRETTTFKPIIETKTENKYSNMTVKDSKHGITITNSR